MHTGVCTKEELKFFTMTPDYILAEVSKIKALLQEQKFLFLERVASL